MLHQKSRGPVWSRVLPCPLLASALLLQVTKDRELCLVAYLKIGQLRRPWASVQYTAGCRLRPLIPGGDFFPWPWGGFFHYLILNAVNEIVNNQVRLRAIFVNDYVTNVVVSVHWTCAWLYRSTIILVKLSLHKQACRNKYEVHIYFCRPAHNSWKAFFSNIYWLSWLVIIKPLTLGLSHWIMH